MSNSILKGWTSVNHSILALIELHVHAGFVISLSDMMHSYDEYGEYYIKFFNIKLK